MADDREQRKKVIELIGEGSARRIRLIVLSVLALVGVVLQGLVYWYAAQMTAEEWSTGGVRVWALTVSIWILTVGLLITLLWRRLKSMPEGAL